MIIVSKWATKMYRVYEIKGRWRRGQQRVRWLDGIVNSMNMSFFFFFENEFEKDPGDGEGEESLACCSPWDCKESYTTE